MGGPGANTRPHQTNTRRPHTKSKLGCKTCKRRHIKCDQQKPQCRNCTKHNKLGPPDLKMTREIEQHLRQWRETGVSPFPSLGVTVHPPLSEYSNTDLRLMYHISNIAAQMEKAESPQHSVWVSRVPLFLNLASKYKFVMHALLALSASHLGWLTESPGTLQLSYYHRGLALNGLQDTIGRFSMENSDAVLAASILLSWQATDWQGWAGIMRGTATVIEQMQAWKESSEFREYLEQNDLFNESPRPNAIGLPESQRILIHVHECLRKLEPFVQGKKEESKGLSDLMAFVRNIKTYLPFESEDEQFEHLHPCGAGYSSCQFLFLKELRKTPM
ncbi:hypothetical protein BDZ91DRAFT_408105 [Kalaharituber pfeilii]|nr:hypothetical protein BDZ91DRAFT_408105 [Kalaharituber pfeilii]